MIKYLPPDGQNVSAKSSIQSNLKWFDFKLFRPSQKKKYEAIYTQNTDLISWRLSLALGQSVGTMLSPMPCYMVSRANHVYSFYLIYLFFFFVGGGGGGGGYANSLLNEAMTLTHFPYYWPFVQENHYPQYGTAMQSCVVSLNCWPGHVWINSRIANDLRRRDSHCSPVLGLYGSVWNQFCLNSYRLHGMPLAGKKFTNA